MGELSCNEVLTSFGLVPNDALEGDGGTGFAGPQTLRFRDGPHAGPNAYVGHVLQQKVRRTIENRKGAEGRRSGSMNGEKIGGSEKRSGERERETLLRHVSPSSSRKPPGRGIDGSSAWRLLRHRRSPPPPAANTTRSGVTHGGQVGLPLMRRYFRLSLINLINRNRNALHERFCAYINARALMGAIISSHQRENLFVLYQCLFCRASIKRKDLYQQSFNLITCRISYWKRFVYFSLLWLKKVYSLHY
ncbi:hypothetical protein ALC60_12912 [Trachymyrmex zeteki]|uniref:Uncharacterized protein n=1 Tax=Mycetomoellerius zeteki TaxID=64791 RepID=A0A151WJA4_9HYME|nr:hypothetical protein ALC60_12912 [Trachymyrmex zeteki]